jgi:hypothetical protein
MSNSSAPTAGVVQPSLPKLFTQSPTDVSPTNAPPALARGRFTHPKPGSATAPTDYSIGFPLNFPVDSLPQGLRRVMEQLAQVYQTPVCLPAMAGLAVLSAAAGKSVVVEGGYKDKQTRLNLYVIAAAERGSGKGNIGAKLAHPLHERSKILSDGHRKDAAARRGEIGLLKAVIAQTEKTSGASSGTKLAEAEELLGGKQRRLDELERDAKRDVTLMIGDTSSEALARYLADNDEALFCYSAEAGSALKVALGKYTDGKGDFDLLLSAYSGDFVSSVRISRARVELKEPCLTLLWLVQPTLLRQLCSDDEAFSRGLTARPLIFDTGSRREIDDGQIRKFDLQTEWDALVDRVLDVRVAPERKEPQIITASDDARKVFTDFHNESVMLERTTFADLVGELSRWRENAIKVAGLFAVVDDVAELTADHARAGTDIVRWASYNYLSTLHGGRRDRQQERLNTIAALVDRHSGSINVGDLAKSHGIDRATLDAVIAACPGVIEIVKQPQPKGQPGQPAQLVRRATGKSTQSGESPSLANSPDSIDSPQPIQTEPPAPHA